MKKVNHTVALEVYASDEELNKEDLELLQEARKISRSAYAPYSQFYVGAALRLSNGEVISGSNQENVAYPSGLCAERVAIYYANAKFPKEEVVAIAINAFAENFEVNHPISPCGSCRQAIAEYEIKQEKDIRIIMGANSGEIHVCSGIKTLLPFMFNEQDLKKD